MKARVTLTVRKSILVLAKRYARRTGKSMSQMFEELMERNSMEGMHTDSKAAAKRLLKKLEASRSVKSLGDDKNVLRQHISKKFA